MKKAIFTTAFFSLLLLCGGVARGQMVDEMHVINSNIITQAKTSYHPVLTGDTCLWSVPRMDLAGCWMDTIWAVKDDSDGYSLIISINAYYSYSGYGSLRSSDDGEKLYFKKSGTDEEQLIMDLSLTVGDTFHTKGLYGEDVEIIVDSVYYEQGLKHVRFDRTQWTTDPLMQPVKSCFIEGFGPNWGFDPSEENALLLVCKHEDGELFYSLQDTTVFKDCTFRIPCHGDGIKPEAKPSVHIYPNPSNGLFHIVSDYEVSNITVYNSLGQLVKIEPNMTGNGNMYEINLNSHPNGVYYIQYQIGNEQKHAQIIKQ